MTAALIGLAATIVCGAIWYFIQCMKAVEIIVSALSCEHGDDEDHE